MRRPDNSKRMMRVLLITVIGITFIAGGFSLQYGGFSFIAGTVLAEDGQPGSQEGQQASAGQEGSQDQDTGAPCPECPPCPDPTSVVLSGLKEKKQMLMDEEDRLRKERKALDQFKEELDERLVKLEELKKQITQDLALMEQKKTEQELQQEAEFEATMNRLVKMYSGMKPKDAAVIINKMDLEVARQIFSRMRETSSAQILGYVDSEIAAKISESIVYKK